MHASKAAQFRLTARHNSHNIPFMHQKRVAIIGGGSAGLICAKECLAQGLNVQLFEKSKTLGGTWKVDPIPAQLQEMHILESGYEARAREVHSSMYDSLRVNIPRHIMGVTDYPFDANFPGSFDSRTFPQREEVLRYIEALTREYNLEEYISYGSEVVEISPTEKDCQKWKVAARMENTMQTYEFDAVAVCNGHFTVPHIPDIKHLKKFENLILHSHFYRDPLPFEGKTVLVLGNGASGQDITYEIASVAKKVYHCARKRSSSLDASQAIGFRSNIYRRPNISQCLSKGRVQLEDGNIIDDVDVIVLCTGFLYDFPFFSNDKLVSTNDRHVYPVYKHFIHPQYPSLAFIGLNWKTLPFLLFEHQSKYFSRILSGKCQLPSYTYMMQDIHAHYETLKSKELDNQYYHDLDNNQFEYMDELRALSGMDSKLPSWRKETYTYSNERRLVALARSLDYRDVPSRKDLLEESRAEFEEIRKSKNAFPN